MYLWCYLVIDALQNFIINMQYTRERGKLSSSVEIYEGFDFQQNGTILT